MGEKLTVHKYRVRCPDPAEQQNLTRKNYILITFLNIILLYFEMATNFFRFLNPDLASGSTALLL